MSRIVPSGVIVFAAPTPPPARKGDGASAATVDAHHQQLFSLVRAPLLANALSATGAVGHRDSDNSSTNSDDADGGALPPEPAAVSPFPLWRGTAGSAPGRAPTSSTTTTTTGAGKTRPSVLAMLPQPHGGATVPFFMDTDQLYRLPSRHHGHGKSSITAPTSGGGGTTAAVAATEKTFAALAIDPTAAAAPSGNSGDWLDAIRDKWWGPTTTTTTTTTATGTTATAAATKQSDHHRQQRQRQRRVIVVILRDEDFACCLGPNAAAPDLVSLSPLLLRAMAAAPAAGGGNCDTGNDDEEVLSMGRPLRLLGFPDSDSRSHAAVRGNTTASPTEQQQQQRRHRQALPPVLVAGGAFILNSLFFRRWCDPADFALPLSTLTSAWGYASGGGGSGGGGSDPLSRNTSMYSSSPSCSSLRAPLPCSGGLAAVVRDAMARATANAELQERWQRACRMMMMMMPQVPPSAVAEVEERQVYSSDTQHGTREGASAQPSDPLPELATAPTTTVAGGGGAKRGREDAYDGGGSASDAVNDLAVAALTTVATAVAVDDDLFREEVSPPSAAASRLLLRGAAAGDNGDCGLAPVVAAERLSLGDALAAAAVDCNVSFAGLQQQQEQHQKEVGEGVCRGFSEGLSLATALFDACYLASRHVTPVDHHHNSSNHNAFDAHHGEEDGGEGGTIAGAVRRLEGQTQRLQWLQHSRGAVATDSPSSSASSSSSWFPAGRRAAMIASLLQRKQVRSIAGEVTTTATVATAPDTITATNKAQGGRSTGGFPAAAAVLSSLHEWHALRLQRQQPQPAVGSGHNTSSNNITGGVGGKTGVVTTAAAATATAVCADYGGTWLNGFLEPPRIPSLDGFAPPAVDGDGGGGGCGAVGSSNGGSTSTVGGGAAAPAAAFDSSNEEEEAEDGDAQLSLHDATELCDVAQAYSLLLLPPPPPSQSSGGAAAVLMPVGRSHISSNGYCSIRDSTAPATSTASAALRRALGLLPAGAAAAAAAAGGGAAAASGGGAASGGIVAGQPTNNTHSGDSAGASLEERLTLLLPGNAIGPMVLAGVRAVLFASSANTPLDKPQPRQRQDTATASGATSNIHHHQHHHQHQHQHQRLSAIPLEDRTTTTSAAAAAEHRQRLVFFAVQRHRRDIRHCLRVVRRLEPHTQRDSHDDPCYPRGSGNGGYSPFSVATGGGQTLLGHGAAAMLLRRLWERIAESVNRSPQLLRSEKRSIGGSDDGNDSSSSGSDANGNAHEDTAVTEGHCNSNDVEKERTAEEAPRKDDRSGGGGPMDAAEALGLYLRLCTGGRHPSPADSATTADCDTLDGINDEDEEEECPSLPTPHAPTPHAPTPTASHGDLPSCQQQHMLFIVSLGLCSLDPLYPAGAKDLAAQRACYRFLSTTTTSSSSYSAAPSLLAAANEYNKWLERGAARLKKATTAEAAAAAVSRAKGGARGSTVAAAGKGFMAGAHAAPLSPPPPPSTCGLVFDREAAYLTALDAQQSQLSQVITATLGALLERVRRVQQLIGG